MVFSFIAFFDQAEQRLDDVPLENKESAPLTLPPPPDILEVRVHSVLYKNHILIMLKIYVAKFIANNKTKQN